MKTIAILNHKGGVGKTTTAINLAVGLRGRGFKVLLVDADLQGHATFHIAVEFLTKEGYFFDWLNDDKKLDAVLCGTKYGIDLIPNSLQSRNSMVLYEANARSDRTIFDRRIKSIHANYDFCIIDCPPRVDGVVVDISNVADYFIVPIQLEPFAVIGLTDMKDVLQGKEKKISVLYVMTTDRFSINRAMLKLEKDTFGDVKHFNVKIPRSVAVPESNWHKFPIVLTQHRSGLAYQELVDEVLKWVS